MALGTATSFVREQVFSWRPISKHKCWYLRCTGNQNGCRKICLVIRTFILVRLLFDRLKWQMDEILSAVTKNVEPFQGNGSKNVPIVFRDKGLKNLNNDVPISKEECKMVSFLNRPILRPYSIHRSGQSNFIS